MKRNIVLILLPIALFALERVNLIKDAGFEKDSGVWHTYSGGASPLDSAIASSHDPERPLHGIYSASCDTRKPGPAFIHDDSALVIQGLYIPKKVADIDSFTLSYSLAPFTLGILGNSWIALYIDAGNDPFWIAGYFLYDGGQIGVLPPRRMLDSIFYPNDTSWCLVAKDVHDDLLKAGIDVNSTVDSVIMMTYGVWITGWFGCKTYWDDIRLTGYADYDVGVKEILSGDSVWAGVYYKPVARIKSFGREAADNFLAIAEIRQGETIVWADTVSYTLPADTEDTLEFDSFPIPDALNYTLTVRTEMYAPGALDESDEDDQVSKPLYGTAIAENPQPQAISLEVESFTANPRVVYSLPQGQSGIISIYDASGRRIESLRVQGSGEVGLPLAQSSGVYFVRLEAGFSAITRKTVIK